MGSYDTRAADRAQGEESSATGMDALNVAGIVLGLVDDLRQLRSGEITIPMARARATLAHEIIRGINLVIAGKKMIEGNALAINGPTPKSKKGAKVIDG
jgi:hypothetical protein